MSMMGRFASEAELSEFPELGGFEIECVTPEYTAFNKFDALHRRAVLEDYAGMTLRGRDAYDLSQIALSDRASKVRPLIEAAQGRVARPRSKRRQMPRPDGGYAHSPAFNPDSPGYAALREGYEQVAAAYVWNEAPPFAEAVNLAKSLDA